MKTGAVRWVVRTVSAWSVPNQVRLRGLPLLLGKEAAQALAGNAETAGRLATIAGAEVQSGSSRGLGDAVQLGRERERSAGLLFDGRYREQLADVQPPVGRKEQCPLEGVLQFADVAGPMVAP